MALSLNGYQDHSRTSLPDAENETPVEIALAYDNQDGDGFVIDPNKTIWVDKLDLQDQTIDKDILTSKATAAAMVSKKLWKFEGNPCSLYGYPSRNCSPPRY